MPEFMPVQSIETILNWFFWVAVALGIGLIIFSLAVMAAGRRSEKLLLSGLIALALGASLNQIYSAVMEGISLEDPFQLVTAIIVASFLILSVFYFATGNPECIRYPGMCLKNHPCRMEISPYVEYECCRNFLYLSESEIKSYK